MAVDFRPKTSNIDFRPSVTTEKVKPSFRSEVVAPFTHAASALAFDVPRTTMEMQRLRGEPGAEQSKEFLYPEQQTGLGKTLRFGLEAPATVLGGSGRLAAKAFGKMAPIAAKGMLGKVAQGAVSGATYGVLQTKPTLEEQSKQIAETAVGGSVLPVAGKVVSKIPPAISGIGKYVVSKGAGLSKNAIDTVGRLGFSKVRDVAKKGVNYIQEDVIPRARQTLLKNITSAGEASKELLQEMGFNPEQIKDVMKISKANMSKYGSQISASWVKTEENLGKALNKVGKQIGEIYLQAAKEDRRINIKNTIGAMKIQLKQMGMVDETGNLVRDYKSHPSTSIKNMAQLYSEYAPRIGKGEISIADFLNFRTRLEASITKLVEGEKFNVPVYKALNILRNDIVNSLAQKGSPYEKFWRNINKEYSDLKNLDLLAKKINTVVNNLPNKIMTQRNKLTDKHLRLYGKDIVNDVEAYNAAQELYPPKETIGLFNLQKPVIRSAFRGAEFIKEATKPATAPIGRAIRKAGQFGASRIKDIMEEPVFSPKTKSFFGQAPIQMGAKLSSKSGQAIFGRPQEPQEPIPGIKSTEPMKPLSPQAKTQPGAILQGKQGIAEPSAPKLLEEAKKYSTAEEWIASQPIFYHTTDSKNILSIQEKGLTGKIGEMSKKTGGKMEKGVFLYEDIDSANEFGKNYKNPSVIQTQIQGKIYNAEKQNKYGWEEDLQIQEIAKDKKIILQLKKDGFVGVKSTELGNPAIFVFEPQAIKTKSQLTSIWQQAHEQTGKALGLEEKVNFNKVNWGKVNTFLRRRGYDVRGADDVKNIYSRITSNFTKNPTGDHLEALNYAKSTQQTIETKAARYFGVTNDLQKAGYITPKGKLLDLSGAKQGNIGAVRRVLDHREINFVLPENDPILNKMEQESPHSNSVGMRYFMNRGNIRLQSNGIDIIKEPTEEQWSLIRRHILDNKGESFYVDISDIKGNTLKSLSYSYPHVSVSKIVNDISSFFKSTPMEAHGKTGGF